MPPDHRAYADVQDVYAAVLLKTGRLDEARSVIETALPTFADKPTIRAGFEKLQASLPSQ